MNTASKSTAKLKISETKTLDTFGISPLVETSSSTTTTIESTTAQISSKSSSPFNALTFREPKLSPSSEVTTSPSSILAIGPNTSSALKSPNTPDSPILPFLNETFKTQQNQQEENTLTHTRIMLASTSGSSNVSQKSTPAGTGPTSNITTSVSSPTNSIKNIKCEPYTALSPCNENTNSQNLLEENSNTSKNNSSNMAMDTAPIRERDGTSASSIIRQNSNSSIGSCPPTLNASSPNNGSNHSNSSNISSNMSQTVDSNGDGLQDINGEKATKKKLGCNINVKDEDNGKTSSSEKSNSSVTSAKNSMCTTPTLNTLTTVKEDPDVIGNLMSIKKEENIVSPDMSPVGFGSIANLSGGSVEGGGRAVTPVKLNDLGNTSSGNGGGGNEKIGSALSSNAGCSEDPLSGPSLSNESCGGGGSAQQSPTTSNNSNTGGHGNCMDYMQQQNHIFVFSTQLANKGAESVLSGQFPTIIAYHCTQPATKHFFEDFLIKNPMKMTKLQRQNSLNICNISIANSQPWMSGCNSMPKMQQKPNGGKINFGSLNTSIDGKSHGANLRGPGMPGFGESQDPLVNENDLMCWEQTRSSIEGPASEGHGIKMIDGGESVAGPQHNVNQHNSSKQPIGSSDTGGDSNIPSLQGVKVPDENLTPQQRQHREEQLAKLKKMNQFLFPENGSDFRPDAGNALQGPNQLGKLGGGDVPGNMGIMINMPVSGPGMGQQSSLNPALRSMPSNVINQNKAQVCNPETTIGDDAIVPPDILGSHDLSGLQCNPNKATCGTNNPMSSQPNITCTPGGVMGTISPNVNVGNLPGNSMPCHGGGISGPGGLMPNSPEVIGNFNQNCGGGDGNLGGGGPSKPMGPGIHGQDINHVGMAQMEWSKLQHQFYEERLKGNKSANDNGCMPPIMCRSNPSGMNVMLRPNIAGACTSTASTGSTQTVRSAQGPPPPYHPTQRSASVPIATQSPNPSSPNNPTSNLSLPSPRTSGTLGIPANSPNMDSHVSTMSVTTSTASIVTTTSTTSSTISNTNAQTKTNFQPESSPTSGNCGSNVNNSRNRNNVNQFNSNPSTPLSHMSPKDLDSFHATAPAGDLKNARPSPQRSKTPLNSNSNNISEQTTNIEGRFPSASPGLSFPSHIQNPASGSVNTYKASGPIERQNSTPVLAQFCRRTDNLPLNPNSGRPSQNKLNHSFDPISSLAQMSQQLTSCVSLNSSIGNNPGIIGVNDINMPPNVNQNIEGMMNSMDSGMDHCSPGSSNNMGMPPHMAGVPPFLSNNCHIGSMIGPMGQRLLNPKMCGGFNSANGGMRDGPGNFHGVMPSHRMMGRMAVNFGNFNVSPNIQVKASTPNTIQYMPVRPQNNNSNMRIPPSLEFLQRYANPQMANSNIMDNGLIGQGNQNGPTDSNKMPNIPGTNPGMSYFQNCNQMGSIVVEQEDMPGVMLSNQDMNMSSHQPMNRGLRPMRQHGLGHPTPNQTMSGPRMQAPGICGPVMSQFPGTPQDSLECPDSAGMFGPGGGPGQIYPGGQQKSIKAMGGLCQNMNAGNSGNNGPIPNSGLLQSEHNSAMQSPVNGPVLLGPNSNIMPNSIPGGNNASPVACSGGNSNINYKPFVGPASNDVKYAQQFHSFQQQLYATSTRSQQSGGNINIVNNSAANPAFFVNK